MALIELLQCMKDFPVGECVVDLGKVSRSAIAAGKTLCWILDNCVFEHGSCYGGTMASMWN